MAVIITNPSHAPIQNIVEIINDKESEILSSAFRKLSRYLIEKNLMKSFRELKKEDRIELANRQILPSEYVEARMQAPWHICFPFLSKGVIRLDTSNPTWLNFKLIDHDLKEKTYTIAFEQYQYNNNAHCLNKLQQWTASYQFQNTIQEGCALSITHPITFMDIYTIAKADLEPKFTPLEKIALQQAAKSQQEIETTGQNKDEYPQMTKLSELFLRAITDLNFLMQLKRMEQKQNRNPQPKETLGNPKQILHTETEKPRPKQKSSMTHIQIVDGVAIRLQKGSGVKIKNGVIRNRLTEQWQVSGHLRRLKTGRVIWINPYTKGPGRKLTESENQTPKHKQKIYRTDRRKPTTPDLTENT